MTEYKKLTNEEGEEIEALSKEEHEAEIKTKEEEFGKKEKELNEQLGKYKDKDFNFKALREAKKEDREKLLEKLSDTERKLYEEQESNKKELDDLKSGLIQENKDTAIDALCGDDEELKKKVLANFDDLNIEAKTKGEMIVKVQKAYNMSVDVLERNPVLGVSRSTSEGDIKKKEKGELTPELKEMGKKLGLSDEDQKKYG